MEKIIKPIKINRSNFGAYGDLISTDDIDPMDINEGYAKRFDDLANINISKDSINQYKIVDLLNYKQNIEKVINNDNVEINIDKLLSELLVNVHINNRLITIDDCIIINIFVGLV